MCYCCTSTPSGTGRACVLVTGWEGLIYWKAMRCCSRVPHQVVKKEATTAPTTLVFSWVKGCCVFLHCLVGKCFDSLFFSPKYLSVVIKIWPEIWSLQATQALLNHLHVLLPPARSCGPLLRLILYLKPTLLVIHTDVTKQWWCFSQRAQTLKADFSSPWGWNISKQSVCCSVVISSRTDHKWRMCESQCCDADTRAAAACS